MFDNGCEVRSTDSVERFLKREGRLQRRTSVQQEKRERGPAVNRTWMAFETAETAENLQLQPAELKQELGERRIDLILAETAKARQDPLIRRTLQTAILLKKRTQGSRPGPRRQ